MSKHFLFLGAWLFLNLISNAQQIFPDTLKKRYPGSNAVLLSEDVNLQYFIGSNGKLQAKETRKISLFVFNNVLEGISDISIPYSEHTNIAFTSGRVYSIEKQGNRKVLENMKYLNARTRDFYVSNIFYGDFKIKQLPIKARMADNNLIEYSYEVLFEDLKYLTNISPSYDCPVREFTFTMEVPDFVNAEVSLHGYKELFHVEEKEEAGKRFTTYKLSDYIPPRSHIMMTSSAYFQPHLLVHTKSYIQQNGTGVNIIRNTNDLYDWYASLVYSLNPERSSLKVLSEKINTGKTSAEDKINAIMNWVQSNITYVAFVDGIAGFKPEEAHKVVSYRYGDCKGMANLLVELLRLQGFDAYHCWVGTRHKPYSYSTPSLAVDNHMICALKHEGKYYFLDATGSEFRWNVVPYHLEGKEVLIGLDRNRFEIVKLPISSSSANTMEISLKFDLAENIANNASGTITLNGHHAMLAQSVYKMTAVERLDRFAENYVDKIFDNAFLVSDAGVKFSDNRVIIHFRGNDAGLFYKSAGDLALFLPKMSALRIRGVRPDKDAPIEFKFPQVLQINMEVANAGAFSQQARSVKNDYDGIAQEIQISYLNNVAKVSYKLAINRNLVLKDALPEWNRFVVDYMNNYYFIKL